MRWTVEGGEGKRRHPPLQDIPKGDGPIQRGDGDLEAIWPIRDGNSIRRLFKGLLRPGGGKHVPDLYGLVPRGADDHAGLGGRVGEGGNGSLVTREDFEELAGLDGPHADLERVIGAGADNLARGVDCEALELDRVGTGEGPEVPIPDEVKGADGAVLGGREENLPVLGELDGLDAGGVLGEGDEAEARVGVPDLNLAVIAAGGDELAVLGVGEGVEVVEVALLLHNVGLGLPLPNQELAEVRAAKGEPLAREIDGGGADLVAGDAEGVDHVEVGHLEDAKDARVEPEDEELGRGMVLGRDDMAVLPEHVPLAEGPDLDAVVRPRGHGLLADPHVDGAILGDGEHVVIRAKKGADNAIAVGGEGNGGVFLNGVEGVEPGGEVL